MDKDTKIQDVMSKNPTCIDPQSTIKEASIKMKDVDTGFLPVCESGRLIGAITDRDIVVRGIAEGLDTNDNVSNIMSKNITYCFDNEPLEEAAEKMQQEGIRRVAVLDQNKRLVGVLSLDDIAVKVNAESLTAETLKEVNKNII